MVRPSRAAVCALAIVAVSCSGSPAAPTPPPQPAQLAGNWSGTVQYTIASSANPQVQAVVLNLTQAGASVNGTYAAQNFDGTISGQTTPSNFSGTFTWNARTTTGAACTGSYAVSGGAGTTTMTWTSPGVTANCTNLPTSLTFAVQRR